MFLAAFLFVFWQIVWAASLLKNSLNRSSSLYVLLEFSWCPGGLAGMNLFGTGLMSGSLCSGQGWGYWLWQCPEWRSRSCLASWNTMCTTGLGSWLCPGVWCRASSFWGWQLSWRSDLFRRSRAVGLLYCSRGARLFILFRRSRGVVLLSCSRYVRLFIPVKHQITNEQITTTCTNKNILFMYRCVVYVHIYRK